MAKKQKKKVKKNELLPDRRTSHAKAERGKFSNFHQPRGRAILCELSCVSKGLRIFQSHVRWPWFRRFLQQDREVFLDLLKYLYTIELQASTIEELLVAWQLSERFLVDSCADLCIQKLLPLPLSWHDSSSILEHIIVVKKTEQTESLAEKSILALANHFGRKNVENKLQYKTELQQISAHVIEFFLSSDRLPFDDEKEVYQLLDDWIHVKYENAESVEDAWVKLQHLVRWPFMDIGHLRGMIRQPEWNRRLKDLLMEALLYHVSTKEEKAIIASDSWHGNMYQRRVNSRILIKCLSGNNFTDQETIFFSITLDIWQRMQKQELETQPFYLSGAKFVWKFMPCGEEPPKMWLQQCSEHPTLTVDAHFWIWNGAPKNAYVRELGVTNVYLQKHNFLRRYIGDKDAAWCKVEMQEMHERGDERWGPLERKLEDMWITSSLWES